MVGTTSSEDALRRTLAERHAAMDVQAEAVRVLKPSSVDVAVEALNSLKVEGGVAARKLQDTKSPTCTTIGRSGAPPSPTCSRSGGR